MFTAQFQMTLPSKFQKMLKSDFIEKSKFEDNSGSIQSKSRFLKTKI